VGLLQLHLAQPLDPLDLLGIETAFAVILAIARPQTLPSQIGIDVAQALAAVVRRGRTIRVKP
jgi:hypothetical protein